MRNCNSILLLIVTVPLPNLFFIKKTNVSEDIEQSHVSFKSIISKFY